MKQTNAHQYCSIYTETQEEIYRYGGERKKQSLR